VTPTTVQGRRAAFVGWTGTQIDPNVILATARRVDPTTTLSLSYRNGSQKVSFSSGIPIAGAQSVIVSLHNGWHLRTFTKLPGAGLPANRGALVQLLIGLLLTLLASLLIFVLGSGRSRAIALVNERTNELEHRAFHDALTGLPNRVLTLDRAEQTLARSRRDGTRVAALFLDLDNFKDINDTLGHRAGDQLLHAVGSRLAGELRKGDTVGRLGGDEFVMLFEGPLLATGVGVVAQKVLDLFATPFTIPDVEMALPITASIGVAEGGLSTADELLRDADVALYRAKSAGKDRFVIFSPEMQEAVDDYRNLELELSRALEAHQFFLLYQPIIDLGSGAMVGVEALLRWDHPIRGIVEPDDFIPVLESTGLIIPIGQWVLEEACRQCARWHRRGRRLAIAVNVSGRQLERDKIVDDVNGALITSGLDPSMLVLEMTETSLMADVEAVVVRLHLLKALGTRIAIDDFGMGYSSISYLQQFPVDVLKIDRIFVSKIAFTTESLALVHMLAELGRVLGLKVVAEGIEDDAQRLQLVADGVDYGQGYLFARPLDASGIEALTQRDFSRTAARRDMVR